MPVAYQDSLGRDVVDRTGEYNAIYGMSALKVEQCEHRVLVLVGKGDDGGWDVTYLELSDRKHLPCVRYSESLHFEPDEIDPAKGLHQQLRCFP